MFPYWGLAIWLIGLVLCRPELAAALLLLAATVVVPLAWQVFPLSRRSAGHRWAVRLQPVAATLLVGSYAVNQGPIAAVLAVSWLLTVALLLLDGLPAWRADWRTARRDWPFDVASLFLVIGAAWGVITRSGWRPLDFSPAIVLLTATHFHYAGFALMLLSAMAARELSGRTARLAVWGVAGGVPLLALGITLSRPLELAAAWLLAATGVVVAVGQLRLAARARTPAALSLHGISGMSLLSSMLLAAAYGWAHFVGAAWLDIPTMVATHGLLNAVGFALAGLIAWHVSGRPAARPVGAGDNISAPAERSTGPRPRQTV